MLVTRRRSPALTRSRAAAIAAAVAVTASAAATWALLLEPRRLVLRRRTVEIPGWPPELDGLRIAAASDLHAGAPQVDDRRIKRIAARLERLDADLIALLGDFVDPMHHFAQRVPPHVVAARLGALRAPLGVLAVLGNHDWAGEGEWVPRALETAGITVLQDEALTHGRGLWIAGLSDLRTRRPDIPRALGPVPDDAPLLVLSHDPDPFHELPDRPSLTLSGHTHGGQVNLPWLRERVAPTRRGYRYGVFREGRRVLVVTSGIGTSSWPIRFLRPPEIVLVTVSTRARSRRRAAPSLPAAEI